MSSVSDNQIVLMLSHYRQLLQLDKLTLGWGPTRVDLSGFQPATVVYAASGQHTVEYHWSLQYQWRRHWTQWGGE